MGGLGVLFLLIGISALPVVAVFIWFRITGYPLGLPWFVCFLGGGIAALFLAAVAQSFFSFRGGNSLETMLLKTFVQIALTEEGSRLLALLLIFKLARPWNPRSGESLSEDARPSFAAAAGLLTGLGFAVVETASYGAVDLNLALLRVFTSAPLHGACGGRVGYTALNLRRQPFRGMLRFCAAVAIHGMYNLMIITPGLPAVLSILIAFSALGSTIMTIRSMPAAARFPAGGGLGEN
jgi:RsiW-degrading membrane proteinase PrsW (M82 family)